MTRISDVMVKRSVRTPDEGNVTRPGGTVARGYGPAHKAERKRWSPYVNAGQIWCARCGGWIAPGTPWDLGHSDFDRSIYTGPEHCKCNRAATAHKANALKRKRAEIWQAMWTRW